MDIMLVFSLLLVQDLRQQGHKNYDCHMQNYAEIFPEKTKSISIILKESEKEAKEELTRNHVVAALQCYGAQGPVQVRLMVSEKKPRSKRQGKRLLQSLKQATDVDKGGCAAQCCLVAANIKRSPWRQTGISLIGKVHLPEVSRCTISSNQTQYEDVAGRAETGKKVTVNATCGHGLEELQARKRSSLFLKIAILCVLIPVVLAFMILIVCEVPCPRSCYCCMPKLDRKASEKKTVTKITSLASLGTPITAKV